MNPNLIGIDPRFYEGLPGAWFEAVVYSDEVPDSLLFEGDPVADFLNSFDGDDHEFCGHCASVEVVAPSVAPDLDLDEYLSQFAPITDLLVVNDLCIGETDDEDTRVKVNDLRAHSLEYSIQDPREMDFPVGDATQFVARGADLRPIQRAWVGVYHPVADGMAICGPDPLDIKFEGELMGLFLPFPLNPLSLRVLAVTQLLSNDAVVFPNPLSIVPKEWGESVFMRQVLNVKTKRMQYLFDTCMASAMKQRGPGLRGDTQYSWLVREPGAFHLVQLMEGRTNEYWCGGIDGYPALVFKNGVVLELGSLKPPYTVGHEFLMTEPLVSVIDYPTRVFLSRWSTYFRDKLRSAPITYADYSCHQPQGDSV